MSDDSVMHPTPEKKRVSWKPILEDFHSADESDAEHFNSFTRRNLIQQCEQLLDPSKHADQADMCHDLLEHHPAEVFQPSKSFEKSIELKGPEIMSQGDQLDELESVSSPSLPPASEDSQIDEMQEIDCRVGLSEAEKLAGMKRRYSMLQQNLKIPVEEERRLKRERLRNLLPVWTKRKAEV